MYLRALGELEGTRGHLRILEGTTQYSRSHSRYWALEITCGHFRILEDKSMYLRALGGARLRTLGDA